MKQMLRGFLRRSLSPAVQPASIASTRNWRLVASTTVELIDALQHFSLDVFTRHLGPHVGYDLAGYLRQTRIRVIAAVRELQRRGISRGRILDVGSLYGAFALPLQRLGYELTVVDRIVCVTAVTATSLVEVAGQAARPSSDALAARNQTLEDREAIRALLVPMQARWTTATLPDSNSCGRRTRSLSAEAAIAQKGRPRSAISCAGCSRRTAL
jgi:hypothetical protein